MSRSVITPTGMFCWSTTGIIPQSFSAIICATWRSGRSCLQQAGLAVITVFSSIGSSCMCEGTRRVPGGRFGGREPEPCNPAFRHGQGVRGTARLGIHDQGPRIHMRHPLALALAVALAAISPQAPAQDASPVPVPAPQAAADQAQANTFFAESPLPLHYPQFDRIRDSDFAPAFDRGMAEELEEIEAIANNPEPATFENTIVALQKTGQVLSRAQTVFYSLISADTNDAREALRAQYAPKFSAHRDAIVLNPKLFARIKAVHDGLGASGLQGEDRRLVEKYYEDFGRAGANLPDADKARLKQINAELAQ